MSSTNPVPQKDVEGSNVWMSQHTRFVCQSKELEPDVILLGDSLLQNFQFASSYKNHIVPHHVLNFCIHGDETQHVLWRIKNGELDGCAPKVIVLMVGTHNSDHNADQIANGIMEIIKQAKCKQPNANIIVMGLLPCGRNPNPKREKHADVNAHLSKRLKGEQKTAFIFPDPDLFVQPDGTISHRDMFDYMHPTETGYAKLADLLLDELQDTLQTFLKTDAPSQGFEM